MDSGTPKPPRGKPYSAGSLPLHERIRRRRTTLKLTGQELAERAGVSPPYISLIEKGVKIPSEEVAEAIAKALGDDPELYRAWAQSCRIEDLEGAWQRLHRARSYYSTPALRRRLSSGEDLEQDTRARGPAAFGLTLSQSGVPEDELALSDKTAAKAEVDLLREAKAEAEKALARARKAESERDLAREYAEEAERRARSTMETGAARGAEEAEKRAILIKDAGAVHHLECPPAAGRRSQWLSAITGIPREWSAAFRQARPHADLVEVPVLADGGDPGDGPIPPELVEDVLRLDPRLLGREAPKRPFAYRLTDSMIARVEDLFRPGDWVVLDSRPRELTADRVHAVRFEGRVILSRVLAKRDSLLLLPTEGRSDVKVLDLSPEEPAESFIVGCVVVTVRGEG